LAGTNIAVNKTKTGIFALQLTNGNIITASILSFLLSIFFVDNIAGIVQPNPKNKGKKLAQVNHIFLKYLSNT